MDIGEDQCPQHVAISDERHPQQRVGIQPLHYGIACRLPVLCVVEQERLLLAHDPYARLVRILQRQPPADELGPFVAAPGAPDQLIALFQPEIGAVHGKQPPAFLTDRVQHAVQVQAGADGQADRHQRRSHARPLQRRLLFLQGIGALAQQPVATPDDLVQDEQHQRRHADE